MMKVGRRGFERNQIFTLATKEKPPTITPFTTDIMRPCNPALFRNPQRGKNDIKVAK